MATKYAKDITPGDVIHSSHWDEDWTVVGTNPIGENKIVIVTRRPDGQTVTTKHSPRAIFRTL